MLFGRNTKRVPIKVVLIGLTAAVVAAACPAAGIASELSFPVSPGTDEIAVNSNGGLLSVAVDGDGYFQLQDEGRAVLPYRIVRVLLPSGEAVESYSFVWSSQTDLYKGFTPQLAPPLVSNDGIVSTNDPVAEWVPGSDRFPATAGKYLGTGSKRPMAEHRSDLRGHRLYFCQASWSISARSIYVWRGVL